MKCLVLHNKPTAEVHPGHMLTGPKKEEEEAVPLLSFLIHFFYISSVPMISLIVISVSCFVT
jgi:hypothetical protein